MAFKNVLIDIETNNLLEPLIDFTSMPYKLLPEARLWCISLRNLDNINSVVTLSNEKCTRDNLQELLKDTITIAGHNIVNFDLPLLKLFGILDYTVGYKDEYSTLYGKPIKTIHDTIIWSKLIEPDRFGGHSLKNLTKDYGDESKHHFEDFSQWSQEMVDYCEQDTLANAKLYHEQLVKIDEWDYKDSYLVELKIVDLVLKQSLFGFALNKDLAYQHLKTFDEKLKYYQESVDHLLPPKKLTKTDASIYTPPSVQFKKDGSYSANLIKFASKLDANLNEEDDTFTFRGKVYKLPLIKDEPLVIEEPASVKDLAHLKSYLLQCGWVPTEWSVRDLTCKSGSKIKYATVEEQQKAIATYVKSTITGLFKEQRLKILGCEAIDLEDHLTVRCGKEKSVKVPTTPSLKVGQDKQICPNLMKLGETASFVGDVLAYFMWRHRRTCIAGSDTVDEFDEDEPVTGFLSLLRPNGRVPTNADTLGSSTGRMKHKGIANLPRVTSLGGKELRELLGPGEGFIQIGADLAAIEARLQGHYIYKYVNGPELAKTLIAEKPNDLHCYDGQTEILTKAGFVFADKITLESNIAQWHKSNQSITYTYPSEVINSEYEGDMISVEGDRLSILMTPEHRNVVLNSTGQYVDILAKDLKITDGTIPVYGLLNNNAGIYREYLVQYMLDEFCNKTPDPENPLCFKTRLEKGELVTKKRTCFVLRSPNKAKIEKIIQILATYDVQALLVEKSIKLCARAEPVTCYQTIIPFATKNLKGSSLSYTTIRTVPYKGTVYCVTVASSYIICRRNGHIFVTGNSVNAKKLGISRDNAKSISYAIMYGSSPAKLVSMLGITLTEAEVLYKNYWDAVLPLKEFKEDVEKFYKKTGNKYVAAIDGRKLNARSSHSLVNLLFQSAGAICFKHAVLNTCQELEQLGYLGNPLVDSENDLKVYLMILYHDELQVAVKQELLSVINFVNTEEDLSLYNQEKDSLTLLIDEDPTAKDKLKALITPAEARAIQYKLEHNLTCDIGHKDDYFYVTEENFLTSAFKRGLDKAAKDLKIKVPLGLAWNSGDSWAATH